MIYLAYLILAACVVFLSVKGSEYVDLIDKKTSLSGAFIGGVMLSAVTSLPELFTSISSTVLLGEPGLCLGNILGSNMFNLAALSIVALFFYPRFRHAIIAKSQSVTAVFSFICFLALVLNMLGLVNIQVFTVSVTSLIILIAYIIGVRSMAGDSDTEDLESDDSPLSLKQVVFRFVLAAIGIIATSILITYVTDIISEKLNLGAGLAGALFLGIATSLPELSSTISLFRMRNYNIAVGNIIGSNLFNFIILAITDVISFRHDLYNFTDATAYNLLIFGTIASVFAFILFKWNNKVTAFICPVLMAVCYFAALIYRF